MLKLLDVEQESFFPKLLRSLTIATDTSDLSTGCPTLVAWDSFDTYYQFDMSDYEHTCTDYEQRFAALLMDTPFARYEVVILNRTVPSPFPDPYSYTMRIDWAFFVSNWEEYFDARTIVVTSDGDFVLESWNTYWSGIRSNFPIGGESKYQQKRHGNAN